MVRSSSSAAEADAASSCPFLDPPLHVAPSCRGGTPAVGAACARADVSKPVLYDSYAVTAARGSQPIADVLADITVIGAAEIARAGAQSLTELLQRQPGVEITQNGGPGSLSGIFLRGANRGQTLVLIDGIRIASSSAGATSLEAIPLDQIDRIEILRGPASSLYGADAIGGVVQVFTRRGTSALTGNVSAGYGTYGTWDVKGGVTGTSGPFSFRGAGGGESERRLQRRRRSVEFPVQRRQGRLQEPERVGQPRVHGRAGTGIHRAVFPQPSRQSVRRRRRASTIGRSPSPRRGRSRPATF